MAKHWGTHQQSRKINLDGDCSWSIPRTNQPAIQPASLLLVSQLRCMVGTTGSSMVFAALWVHARGDAAGDRVGMPLFVWSSGRVGSAKCPSRVLPNGIWQHMETTEKPILTQNSWFVVHLGNFHLLPTQYLRDYTNCFASFCCSAGWLQTFTNHIHSYVGVFTGQDPCTVINIQKRLPIGYDLHPDVPENAWGRHSMGQPGPLPPPQRCQGWSDGHHVISWSIIIPDFV